MNPSPRSLSELLNVDHLLLDFDGPVASLFAGYPAADVARQLRASFPDHLSDCWPEESDPLALYRHVAEQRPDLAADIDTTLVELEMSAARQAVLTPGVEPFLAAVAEAGLAIRVVSNNSSECIAAFLAEHRMRAQVAGVHGRRRGEPDSMKPSARLLLDAMTAAGAGSTNCVFVGDAVRDVEAGTAAGVPTIGYANKPGKHTRLTDAGAAVVVDSLNELTSAVQQQA